MSEHLDDAIRHAMATITLDPDWWAKHPGANKRVMQLEAQDMVDDPTFGRTTARSVWRRTLTPEQWHDGVVDLDARLQIIRDPNFDRIAQLTRSHHKARKR